jgi:hypothetical protein
MTDTIWIKKLLIKTTETLADMWMKFTMIRAKNSRSTLNPFIPALIFYA